MGYIVSVVNHKGGVGKTTSAVNLAACLGVMGQKVLLVDLDPQGSATASYGVKSTGESLLQAFQKTDALPVHPTGCQGIDLVASGPAFAAARQRFSGAIGNELLLRCLGRTNGDWTWTIIDCPPSMEILTLNALMASQHVVVPVEASYLGLNGLDQIIQTVEHVRQRHNKGLEIEAVIPCRAHPRRRMHKVIMATLENMFPNKVSPAVRENVSLAEAPGSGMPITQYAPKSNGALDYREVAEWLFQHFSKLSLYS